MSNEVWKPVAGYEDLYHVSNKGRVKRIIGIKARKERVLKPWAHKRGGYPVVALSKEGRVKNFLAHRLVAGAFIPKPENLPQVNHIDGETKNNSVENLEWVTNRENTEHAYENNMNTKTCSFVVLDTDTGKHREYHSGSAASLAMGMSVGWIHWAVKTKGPKFNHKNYSVEEIRKAGDVHV